MIDLRQVRMKKVKLSKDEKTLEKKKVVRVKAEEEKKSRREGKAAGHPQFIGDRC